MEIEVELPDGRILVFPQGTPQSEMSSAIQRLLGTQPTAPQSAGNPALDMMRQAGLAGAESTSPRVDVLRPFAGTGGPDMPASVDVPSSLLSGIARGGTALADLPFQIGELGARARGAVPLLGAGEGARASGPEMPFTGAATRAAPGMMQHQPSTTAGEYAQTVGEFLPGAALTGPGNMLRYGVVPGLLSEAAGQATEGASIMGVPVEPIARTAAAIAAPAIPNMARRVVSPYGGQVDQYWQRLIDVLDDAGVSPTAGQRVGNQALQRRELATAAGVDRYGDQAEDFTRAALRTIGSNGERATDDVLDAALTRIGGEFDDVVRGVDVVPTDTFATRMADAVSEYQQLAPTTNQPAAIGNMADDVLRAWDAGRPIPASTLTTWRSRLSRLTRSSDAATRDAAINALEAIDDALADTLTNLGRAEDVARLAAARSQYRNFLAIEDAAVRAGEDAAVGLISPARLQSAVQRQGRRAYAVGNRGDIAELSRAGTILTRPNTSGTAENLAAFNVPQGVGGLLGAVAGQQFGNPLVGGLLGAMAPTVANRMIMTGPVQGYLANQALGRGPSIVDQRMLSAVPGLLAGAN